MSPEPVIYKRRRMICGLKSRGTLGCSDHEKVEVMILRGESSTKSRARTLNFRRENFNRVLGLCGKAFRDKKVKGITSLYVKQGQPENM